MANLKCPNKQTKLYKRLISQLNVVQATKLFTTLTSESFDKWYGNGKRYEDGSPIMDNKFNVYGDSGRYNFFNRIEFKTQNDLEKFFSSLKTKGIVKHSTGKYYVSKNRRKEGIEIINALQKLYPNMVDISQYQSDSQAIGSIDQSLPIIRVNINKNYFEQGQFVFNALKAETPIVIKEDPRDFIINRLSEYNTRINNKIKDAKRDKDNTAIIKYEKLYNQNKDAILKLQTDSTISSIVDQAKVDLKYIQTELKKDNLTTEDLTEIGNLIDLYKGIANVNSKSSLITVEDLKPKLIVKVDAEGNEFEEEDITDLTKSIQYVASQFNTQESIYDAIIKQFVTAEFNKTNKTNIDADDLFQATKDLGFAAGARDTASVSNRLLNLLSMVRSSAVERANAETLDNQRKREAMSDGLKKSSLFNKLGKQDFMKMLWQKDADGKETGGLINRYSNKYWKFRNSYFKDMNSKDKTKIANAKRKHYANHEYVNYFETEEEKQIELDRLTDLFGEARATAFVEEQDLKFQEYRLRREEKFEDIDGELISTLDKETYKDIWELENNPQNTINSLKTGDITPNPKGGIIFNSFEFVKAIPKKEINGVKTDWYDESFEQLEKDSVALEYYEYVKETTKELLKQYPKSYLEEKGVHSGFIPMITKDLFADFIKQGLSQNLSNLKGSIRDLYTIKTFSKTHNHIKPATGEVMNTLNIQMLSPRFKTIENGKLLDTEDVITDLDEILKVFIPVTNLYKHKTRVETTFNLIAESIDQLKGIKTSPTGAIVTNNKGEAVSDDGNLSKLKEMVTFEIDTFYGQQESKLEKASATKKLNAKEKEIKSELEAELVAIEAELSDTEFLTEEREKQLQRDKVNINSKLSDLGVNLSATKSVKSVLRWYQLLAQGWNLTSPIIELLYGTMSNYTHATGGIDYNEKQFGRGWRLALSSVFTASNTKESKKFNNIIEKFNIIGDISDHDRVGATNSVKNKFSVRRAIKPYELAKNMDKISKGASAVATMLNTKIYDKDGNESNYYDALDENANLREEFQTEDNIKQWTLDYTSTEINDMQRLRAKITQINKRNHGNYDPNAPIPFNASAGGKAVLQFRRWLLEGVASRWENERYDASLARTIKGRYRSYGSVYKSGGPKLVASSLFLLMSKKLIFRKVDNQELIDLGIENETDIENMRKNATGLLLAMSMWMMLLLAKSLSDDDEDKDFSGLKFLTNMGGRLQQDLWFYANPGEGNSILGNIVPAMKLYDKIDAWQEACWQTMFETDPEFNAVYESGQFKGTDKWLIKTGELLPGTASVIKTIRLGKTVL